ncbi:MAG: UDP-N-acetylmuramate--L-alanine ligase [Muribaculaceae bacterium]|nr:UDP-N-acetylmuramate--L-alanine ligase [Muribaculaceae bacterium]
MTELDERLLRGATPDKIYFIGAGGIGMANLVRYFLSKGAKVAGYDRTSTPLTDALIAEGANIVFDDDPTLIPKQFRNPAETLVVRTPAVPDDNRIITWFRENGFEIIKRARLLGIITLHSRGICIAGSHGKTTTCSMTANILRQTPGGCNAFLGGILRNTGSNLVLSDQSDLAVIEADEYDRSFHQLSPWIGVVTSCDPDHLDIYGDEANYLKAFSIFTSLIRTGGYLLLHKGLKMKPDVRPGVQIYRYSANDGGDWHARDITYGEGTLSFTLVGPDGLTIPDIKLGVPVEINIDNAVAAAAASILAGASVKAVRKGLEDFKGAKRRFEIHMDGSDGHPVLIDDYAHSPNEVKASIESVRKLYPGKKLSVIFQPHLYTRTRDFAPEFAEAHSGADEVIMPEIYPARELPIPGVDSNLILKEVKCPEKRYCERKDLLNLLKISNFGILMTLGAADIDAAIPEIRKILMEKTSL